MLPAKRSNGPSVHTTSPSFVQQLNDEVPHGQPDQLEIRRGGIQIVGRYHKAGVHVAGLQWPRSVVISNLAQSSDELGI